MPRLFDAPRFRYTYTVLMSAAMSLVMSFSLGLLRMGISWKTFTICLLSWPLAFVINMVAANIISPLMRNLTVWLLQPKEGTVK